VSAAGFFGDKTYLIILQDNQEIRSTGGLMSVWGCSPRMTAASRA
jgi:hypothetical protein